MPARYTPLLPLALLCCLVGCKGSGDSGGDGPQKPVEPAEPPLEARLGALVSIKDVSIPTGSSGRAFAIRPDGEEFAVGATDGAVILSPLSKPGERRVLVGHREVVMEAVYTPDGGL